MGILINMSVNWTFLTKSFMPMRYRDTFAVAIIGGWAINKWVNYNTEGRDQEFVMTRLYTHDESDIEFREAYNMTDAAVKRDKIMAFAARVKEERARRERTAMLEAYNELNGKSHETSEFK